MSRNQLAVGSRQSAGGGGTRKEAPLLPCPFCGGSARVRMEPESPPDVEEPFWVVSCCRDSLAYRRRTGTGCPVGAMAIGPSRQQAVDHWNTRIPQEASE